MKRETKEIIVHAKTVEKAVDKAAEELGVDRAKLQYELISKTDTGFLSFLGGRRVEIKAWAEVRTKTPTTRANGNGASERRSTKEETTSTEPPLSDEETKNLVEDLRSFCEGICQRMSDGNATVESFLEDDVLTLEVKDEFLAGQISKNKRLAECLEHILRKKPRYLKRELPFRIFIDVSGIRKNRETELITMAKDLSRKVVEKQRPIVLSYRSSYDRKIIHMALDGDDRVYTKSIGSGANRKLMILPAKDQVS